MSNILKQRDIENAMSAAVVTGDDNIQMNPQGTILPESFTHGNAKQPTKQLNIGVQSGEMIRGTLAL
jgi:predicted metalloprotease